MSDRLEELRRQRALLAQHLAWLDREIEGAEIEEEELAPKGVAPRPASASGLRLTTPSAAIPTLPEVPVVSPFLGSGATSAMPETPGAALPPRSIAAANIGGPAVPPEVLLDEYRVAPENLRSDVRKGCFLYFALAFLLLGLGIAVLWFAFRRE